MEDQPVVGYALPRVGLVDILITNLLLLGPLFFLMRRWRLPFGTATILLGTTGLLMQVVNGVRFPEQIAIALLVGLVTDSVLARLQGRLDSQASFRAVALVVPLVQWSLYFLVAQLRAGIAWPPEIWTGSIVLASLTGVALSLVAAPPSVGSAQGRQVDGLTRP